METGNKTYRIREKEQKRKQEINQSKERGKKIREEEKRKEKKTGKKRKEKKWQQSRVRSLEGLCLPSPGEGECPAGVRWMRPLPLPPALHFHGRYLPLSIWGQGSWEQCITGDVRTRQSVSGV